MLTKLTIHNFKRFDSIEVELGSPVVFIGPNDCGKTTALQALALWDIGLKRWNERRRGKQAPEKRPGVTINRRDLIAVPVPDAALLWRNLHVRDVERVSGKPKTSNVLVVIIVEGVTEGRAWSCGLEFYYANQESFYCRPLRARAGLQQRDMRISEDAARVQVAYLPPMSGLAAQETRIDRGAINVRIGEGRTAEVLRNLCHLIPEQEGGGERWRQVCETVETLFGVRLQRPEYVFERGEIVMAYRSRSGVLLDLSASGRGLQQTLLLLAYLASNPGAILLLDEPDAHLEILRQRQTYSLLTETAHRLGSQVIAASHSEVILNEAARRDVVVAFVGKPHRIDDRGSQVLKALTKIGFEQYYEAEQKGWVLYLEGSSDLAILQAFARRLGHAAAQVLARPFIHYVCNQPSRARDHFCALREAKHDLVGLAIYDRLDVPLQSDRPLREEMWTRREVENYLCQPETLVAYAEASAKEGVPGALFESPEVERRKHAMNECIQDLVPRLALQDQTDEWWVNTKVSDEFLDRLFPRFFQKLGLPNLMTKSAYHTLAPLVPEGMIDPEVSEMLDAIVEVARQARPLQEDEGY
jgi:energy-coupling factor transporter ATP-binding protein EcfA2